MRCRASQRGCSLRRATVRPGGQARAALAPHAQPGHAAAMAGRHPRLVPAISDWMEGMTSARPTPLKADHTDACTLGGVSRRQALVNPPRSSSPSSHLVPGGAEPNGTGHDTPEQGADRDDVRAVEPVAQDAADGREGSLRSAASAGDLGHVTACGGSRCLHSGHAWTPARHRVMVPSWEGVAFRERMMNRYTAGRTCVHSCSAGANTAHGTGATRGQDACTPCTGPSLQLRSPARRPSPVSRPG